jgi:hypothetical protein
MGCPEEESRRTTSRYCRETFTILFSKTILRLALGEPKTAYDADQLCSGLEGGIKGAIHAGQLMWDQGTLRRRTGDSY